MRLSRTFARKQVMVHDEACKHAKTAHEWRWAQTKKHAVVAETIKERGYKTCKVCDPLGTRGKK